MSHVLEIDGVQLQFGGRKILSAVYLKCETGKITGLLGKNGQGKSCLMKAIYGTMPCEKSARFDGISIPESFRTPGIIKYLPQVNFIPGSLSIRRAFLDFEVDRNEFKKRFPEFAAKDDTPVGSFSGGERRLAELYLIIKSSSWFAMLDEPFTHLNPIQIEKVKELLREEAANKGMLVTDHMYSHIIDICDDLYVLSEGRTFLTKAVTDIEKLGYARF